jgi:hypothetical protein
MIARRQVLPAPDTVINLIHSASQDNGISPEKVSVASQKSNPYSSSFATELIAWARSCHWPYSSFVRTSLLRTGPVGCGGVAYQAEVMTVSGPRFYGAHTEADTNVRGRPVQVLVCDTETEQVPGCNMAFRKKPLISFTARGRGVRL